MSWDSTTIRLKEDRRIVTVFMPVPSVSAMAFLQQAHGIERFYWADPTHVHRPLVMAGIGIAAEIIVPPVIASHIDQEPLRKDSRYTTVAKEAIQLFEQCVVHLIDNTTHSTEGDPSNLLDLMRPRFFGGFSFQDDFTPDNTWAVFNVAHFILPHYLFIQSGDNKYLAINALVGVAADLEEEIAALEQALFARLELANNLATNPARWHHKPEWRYPMTAAMWHNLIQQAKEEIKHHTFEKVVLARVCEILVENTIDAVEPITYLEQQYSDSYRFLFEPVPNHAFFGATPELLVRKGGSEISTMALAGSIARGQSASEDEDLANELLFSEKDNHEHQLVVASIQEHLKPLISHLHSSPSPDVLKLKNIQHLYTPISGFQNIGDTRTILDFVQVLHPTPALGGVPRTESLRFLQHAEPVPRGWYAAPIGWFDQFFDGEFAVAIRSAITQYDRAWLYAGAGIVNASLPEQEWAETQLKFKPMLEALGATEDHHYGPHD